ncbi:hypothetical protein EJ04DRAFT_267774 [Polyplosphaeria fusca]|uniref:Uncharacterized protein n=1 Tax=Polyplosphaeria fusca TaxID=682080 RepID=A0A9P4QWD8_9PLEO|nr:hypothetical protein EJ04DRAFT_267774 [Polyplosphaeria fusca]
MFLGHGNKEVELQRETVGLTVLRTACTRSMCKESKRRARDPTHHSHLHAYAISPLLSPMQQKPSRSVPHFSPLSPYSQKQTPSNIPTNPAEPLPPKKATTHFTPSHHLPVQLIPALQPQHAAWSNPPSPAQPQRPNERTPPGPGTIHSTPPLPTSRTHATHAERPKSLDYQQRAVHAAQAQDASIMLFTHLRRTRAAQYQKNYSRCVHWGGHGLLLSFPVDVHF